MNRFTINYSFLLLLLALPIAAAHAQINAFGLSSEIADHALFVGHPAPSDEDPGVVYIYARSEDGESWEVVGELMASDATVGDMFGYQIVASGDHLAVGSPSMEGNGGAIYLFAHNQESGNWEEIAKLSGTTESPIGGSVAFSGSLLVSGGMVGLDSTSTVTVFRRADEGFVPSGTLTPDEPQPNDLFGATVGIGGNEAIYVGAPGSNEGAGAIYHFAEHEDGWHGQQFLSGSDERINGVALGTLMQVVDDSKLLIGAPGIIPNVQPTGPPPSGKLVWALAGPAAIEVLQVVESDSTGPDFFGLGFSAHHSTLLAGTPLENSQAGSISIYELDGDSLQWSKTGEISSGDGDTLFGMIISFSDQLGIVSAPASNLGKGVVRVIQRDAESGEWSLSSALKTGKELVLLSSGSMDCTDGVAGQFDCGNVDLLSFMTVEDLGGTEGVHTNDVWGWVDPETNREYALVGRTNGTSFVDITDPSNPVLKGDLPLTEGANPAPWRDIKVYSNHAFIVADNAGEHGMQVFDLTHLRQESDGPITYLHDAHYDGIASAHNVVINEESGFAYVVGSSGGGDTCGGGLHMVDIRDPLAPAFAGCFADVSTGRQGTGYSHDAQCVIYDGPDTEHTGKEICFNSNETALSISDVTDKENTIALAAAEYPNVAYSHQGWITDDFEYFYMNDELDELQEKVVGTRTLIWDITDLDDPQLVNEFMSENLSSDHNLYIQGDVMYQSNYKSGLRIFDISDRSNPVEIGFFDTYPEGTDKPGFEGSWSNYPYFPSGTIIVTSINEGLFIVQRQNIDI